MDDTIKDTSLGGRTGGASPLTVYKASAGSGKTFTLAVEFIKLVILNPRKYENILAVTFTNKATEEMKHRIVSQLYGLSHGLKSSNDYMEKITSELDVTEDFVRKNATLALHNLLHNYNQFRVQTIDAFFQSILRNMVKELGLGNNLRISLNDQQVISEAVDSMMETLDSDQKLMHWIIDYVGERMDDNKSWNISGEVKSFGMNLSREVFKSNEHLLENIENDEKFFERYKGTLHGIINDDIKYFKEQGEAFFSLLENTGMSLDDLSFKDKGVASYFLKLKKGDMGQNSTKPFLTKRVEDAMVDSMAWGNKHTKDELAPIAEAQLIPFLKDTEVKRKRELRVVRSAQITLKNINKMRLLFSIRKELDRQNVENSRFMLSNTQMALSSMIQGGGNIAPFIYEKIGAYLKHVMIDEFQDTSTVQWQNFKVLLENCMAGNEDDESLNEGAIRNLLVGDVKQSIYRFRSGDWRLLGGIGNEFDEGTLNIETLKTNYRSERNIIEFNNRFFELACKLEADRIMPEQGSERDTLITDSQLSPEAVSQLDSYAIQLRNAYKDVKQLVPESKPARGLIRFEFLPEEKDEYVKEAKKRTLDYIKGLLEQGVSASEIAILVRFNFEASDIAAYFAKEAPEISIVSEQAFSLGASPLVMMIIAVMRMLINEKDVQSRVVLTKLYVSYILKEDVPDNSLLITDNLMERYMPEAIWSEEGKTNMLTMSLYELAEYTYKTLELKKLEGQGPYATAFFDCIKKYMEDNVPTIDEFLEAWDLELANKAISIGGDDSIRVITIHKSKGLEFKHLVMPFASWHMTSSHTETLWCKIKDDTFSELPFIPVDYTNRSSLSNSIYESYGLEEWMQEIVDNLNLLYVAFTRAERSLFVICDQNRNEDYRGNIIMDVIGEMDGNAKDLLASKPDRNAPKKKKEDEPEKQLVVYTEGEHYLEKKKEKVSDNVFECKPENIEVTVNSFSNDNIEFRQSNKSREFANDTLDDNDSKRYTTMGSIMHMLFSRIRTLDDIDKELRQFEFDGVIYDDTLTADELRTELKQKFNNEQIKQWFSDRWTVFNECNIMRLKDGRIIEERPDRVITDGNETIVIDYKFGKENDAYQNQVKRYMKLMTDMGHQSVQGFIWYVNLDKVESVKLKV